MNTRNLPLPQSGNQGRGFTLIEVLVVLVVVGVLYSIIVLSLGVIGDDRDLQREARRMMSLIEIASEEAELQGRDFGVEFVRQGYRFVEYDPLFERWGEILGDEVLRARRLPDDFEFDLFIEDRRIQLADHAAETESDEEEDGSPLLNKYAPHGLILSSGDLSPLQLDVLRHTDESAIRVRIEPDGSITLGDEDGEFE